MANWERKLDLRDVWRLALDNKITMCELAKIVADKLIKLRNFKFVSINDEKNDLTEKFQDLAANDETTKDDFDEVLEELYNWGDIRLNNEWPPRKVCWIATLF